MPSVDVLIETEVSNSVRARQVQAAFDVPEQKRQELKWTFDLPIEEKEWRIGMVVGPSGSGKSTLLRRVFGEPRPLEWRAKSVVDDFDSRLSVADIADACGAVGFNTIPAWLRPYSVLSNGEKFRVELARRLLETDGLVVIDEFTSVVDRQVARIASHAAQKYIRKRDGVRLVVASCHYDIEEWLQPDWVYDTGGSGFRWRSLQRRPAVEVELRRVAYDTWRLFAPFHYMSAELHHSAVCFALHVDNKPVCFAGVLHFPHPRNKRIKRVSRLVTLPDWQGLGLAMSLCDRLGAAYAALGFELRTYPAHRALVRAFQRRETWRIEREAGNPVVRKSKTSGLSGWNDAMRPCAVFSYVGPRWERLDEARRLLSE